MKVPGLNSIFWTRYLQQPVIGRFRALEALLRCVTQQVHAKLIPNPV